MPRSLAERLERLSIPEPMSGCCLWLGAVRGPRKYGLIKIGGVKHGAHRVSYAVAHGPIPVGANVLHKCDVPACINPKHLFLGSQADNMADRSRKGRAPSQHGASNPFAKLSEADVLAIRASRESASAAAARYGIGKSTITAIRARRTWAHLKGA